MIQAGKDIIERGPEGRAAFEALEKERAAYRSFRLQTEEVSIDCKLNVPRVTDCYVLRYRVLPVPEILVTVQGVQRWVELGTTVGMVLAPHEPVRATRALAGRSDGDIENWRNATARVRSDRLTIHRLYQGGRHAIQVQPGSASDAIRNVVLQPGDEIKWSN